MLSHLPPALHVLDHDWTQCHSWGVSGGVQAPKGASQKEKPEQVVTVILWCKTGTVQPLPLRNQEAGFRTPTSQGTGTAGLARRVAAGVPTQDPEPPPPHFSPAVSFLTLQQEWRPSLRDRQNVLAVGVTREARGVEGASVEDPVQNLFAAFAVLVSQQGVHEGVRRSLAVGQALGQHTPVGADGHRGGQLYQPAETRSGGRGRHCEHSLLASLSFSGTASSTTMMAAVIYNSNSNSNGWWTGIKHLVHSGYWTYCIRYTCDFMDPQADVTTSVL